MKNGTAYSEWINKINVILNFMMILSVENFGMVDFEAMFETGINFYDMASKLLSAVDMNEDISFGMASTGQVMDDVIILIYNGHIKGWTVIDTSNSFFWAEYGEAKFVFPNPMSKNLL